MTDQSKRLLSLDVFRGITIAGMIMVNDPGSWKYVYSPLRHADWHGITPTDVIFPFFLFIMGISTYISLKKFNFEPRRGTLLKIVKRTAVIFLIGLILNWLNLSFGTFHRLDGGHLSFGERLFKAMCNFENLRIPGVLQRLAVTYCITALIAVFIKHRYIVHIITGLLIGYFLLLLFGNGFENNEQSIVCIIDRAILSKNHLHPSTITDANGPISTMTAVCNVLIGFLCAKIIIGKKENHERLLHLFIVGSVLTFAGMLLSYGCPINKRIWTPTFVLFTSGLAASFLSLLIWIIDVKGNKKWGVFFESFGVNPLFIYTFAGVLSTLLGGIRFTYSEKVISLGGYVFSSILQPVFGNEFGSLVYALLFVGLCWMVGNILYRKKIYIKI